MGDLIIILMVTSRLGGQYITVCGAPVGEFPALPGALQGEVGELCVQSLRAGGEPARPMVGGLMPGGIAPVGAVVGVVAAAAGGGVRGFPGAPIPKSRGQSGSSSCRSRSSSSSSSSSHGVRWQASGRNRKIDPGKARDLETRRFKARADLLAYAAKHPGAIGGGFLSSLFEKARNRLPRETKELREVSVTDWACKQTLGEVRDRREIQTLARCIDLLTQRDLSVLLDTLSQRITAIIQAKQKGGSWDKAQQIELVAPEGGSLAPSGMLRLLA